MLALIVPGPGVLAQNIPSANPPTLDKLPEPTAADRAWEALLVAKSSAERFPDKLPDDAAARQQARDERAGRTKAVADQAQNFYTANPAHYWVPEARNVEIFSLIQAVADGEEMVLGRLGQAVANLRAATAIPVKFRARGVAAHEFTKAVRGVATDGELKEAVEKTARELIREFPSEPQGYEALFTLARASPPAKSVEIAQELVASPAPEEIRKSARTLLDRQALIGQSLAEVMGPEGADVNASLPSGQPAIVYSWATWGPGSIELGRMIQARRFAAIGVCLDEQLEAAKKTEQEAGLGGRHCYDPKGWQASLVDRLKFSTAGQIYLVDAQGVIRDVRGGDDLEAKLTDLGFRTPEIVVTPTP